MGRVLVPNSQTQPAGTIVLPLGSRNGAWQEEFAMENAPYMGIIGWIVLGLIAGFIGSKIVNKTGEGAFLDIILGIVGALVGGFLFNMVGAVGVTGFNIWSMFVAVIGSIVVLVIYHMATGRRAI
jgi:uncharacterized membrane protein YeaQ/YmgE (transglycosylase-associated protein family)